jgi:pimeloyl-ACP methyl ester carboxylesterase
MSLRSIAQAKIAYQTTDLPSKLARYHRHVDDTFWGWNDIRLDADFRSWNIESSLGSIRCPVLLLQGEDDEYGTARQLDAIRSRVPWAEVLLIPDCGHAPHKDQPEIVLQRIQRFIKSLP